LTVGYTGSNEDDQSGNRLMGDYREWLAATYPEVEESIEYEFDSHYPTPGSVPTALEYIDEFVAQSDEYPLTEPVPAGDYGGPLT